MSCFNNELYAQAAENAGPFHPSSKNFRHSDERASSHSGSEDGSGYIHYADPHKTDIDCEENPNAGLTSQTLNADGTPKRPMNAFMIFARRRRPQVSAENQSMRTGEISKILSREWNAMEMMEKQFYLDQAKQLKENFNTKYPDYVYRRRPNNSRKRRKTEVGSRSLDNPLPIDPGDDLSGGTEFGEHSSIEGEEPTLENSADLHYSRIPHDPPTTYGDHTSFVPGQSRSSAYTYPASEVAYRQIESHDARIPYMSSAHERVPQEVSSTTSLGSPRASEPPHQYSYIHPQSHPPSYTAEQNNGQPTWESRGTAGRAWLSDQNERPLSSMSTSKSHNYPSSASPPQSWPNTTSAMSITASNPTHSPNFQFPTLNSPFYPNQVNGNYSARSSTSSTPSLPSSTLHYDSVQDEITGAETGRHSAPYDPRSYARSPSISPLNGYPLGASHEAHSYPSQHSRSIGVPRLPSVPSISTYSHAQAMHTSSARAGSSLYWAREKLEGQ